MKKLDEGITGIITIVSKPSIDRDSLEIFIFEFISIYSIDTKQVIY